MLMTFGDSLLFAVTILLGIAFVVFGALSLWVVTWMHSRDRGGSR